MAPIIQVSGIRKSYGRTIAVDEVSFDVDRGEIASFVVFAGASSRVFSMGVA